MPFRNKTLNDGNVMPMIAFGTGTALGGSDASFYVEQALDVGFRHVDTAAMYRNEDSVGEAIQASPVARSDIFVTTKYSGGGPIGPAILNSLLKLGLTHVDLYLVHWPRFIFPRFKEHWAEFEEIKTVGLAKSIGVSNFGILELEAILSVAEIVPAVNQINFHPYNYALNKPLLDFCTGHNISVSAYSSLAPLTRYPGGPVDVPVKAAAERLNVTSAQVLFLWVLSKNVTIVTTSSKEDRLEECLAVADLPPLTEREVAAIDAAGLLGAPSHGSMMMCRARSYLTLPNILLLCLFACVIGASVRAWRKRRASRLYLRPEPAAEDGTRKSIEA